MLLKYSNNNNKKKYQTLHQFEFNDDDGGIYKAQEKILCIIVKENSA